MRLELGSIDVLIPRPNEVTVDLNLLECCAHKKKVFKATSPAAERQKKNGKIGKSDKPRKQNEDERSSAAFLHQQISFSFIFIHFLVQL